MVPDPPAHLVYAAVGDSGPPGTDRSRRDIEATSKARAEGLDQVRGDRADLQDGASEGVGDILPPMRVGRLRQPPVRIDGDG